MGKTKDKKNPRKYQKYRKQSENRGVDPEERKKEPMAGIICGRDRI